MDNELVGGDKPQVQQKKNTTSIIALGALAAVAVALVIGVVLVKVLKNSDNKCLDNNDAYDIETCVNSVYDDKGREDAMRLYDRAIDEAYNAGDEQKFYDLLMDRANALVSRNGDCEAAASSIEDERVRDLPASGQKGVFYSEVIGFAMMCNKTEMEEDYMTRLNELNKSGEIEIYAY